jgi:DNA-binding XRE family transcriptional regulator
MTRTHPVAKYRLRHSVYKAHTESLGLNTDRQQGEAFGFSRKTINEVRNERIHPSADFMASVCAVLKVRTDAVFEIVPAERAA